MNPSSASEELRDPTWDRWRGFAERSGYGGQIVVNPVPFRSAQPADAIAVLKRIALDQDPQGAAAIARNLAEVRLVAAEPAAWIIGWGDEGARMNDALRCHRRFLDALREGGAQRLLVFGLTKGHNPKHVLARGRERIPDGALVYEFDPKRRATSMEFRHGRPSA